MSPTRRIALHLVCAALVPVSCSVGADVYKCAGEGGVPVYQEMPCGTAKELRNFQTDPPEITILPAPRIGNAPPNGIREAPAKNAKTEKDGNPAKAAGAGANAAERRHVRLGMSEGEVLAKLGHPDVTIGSKNAVAPRWTYMPAPGDPETVTTLTFAKGQVVDIERRVVKK